MTQTTSKYSTSQNVQTKTRVNLHTAELSNSVQQSFDNERFN